MSRRCINSSPSMNNGSVFNGGTAPSDPISQPLIDGEALCEICATVDGEPMWVTPFICVDTQDKTTRTIYLNNIGQEITGEVIPVDPEQCSDCEKEE